MVGHDLDVGIDGDCSLLETCSERLDQRRRVGADVAHLAGPRLQRRGRPDQVRALLVGETDADRVRQRRVGRVEQREGRLGELVGHVDQQRVHSQAPDDNVRLVNGLPHVGGDVREGRLDHVHVEAELGGSLFGTAGDQLVERARLATKLERNDDPAGFVRPGEDRIGDHAGQHRRSDEQPGELPSRPTLQPQPLHFTLRLVGGVGLRHGHSGSEEVLLRRGEPQLGARRPAPVVVEPRSVQQIPGVATRGLPLVDGDQECRLLGEVVTVLIDPVAQPVPFGEQRLVRDLDRRAAGCGITIEREQSVAREHVDHVAQRDEVDVERHQFRRRNSAPTDDVAERP